MTVVPSPVESRSPLDSVPASYSSQLHTLGILLRWLLSALVPVPIPVLLCRRDSVPDLGTVPACTGLQLLVRDPRQGRGRGVGCCLGSRLVGPVVQGLLLGGGLHLVAWIRSVRRNIRLSRHPLVGRVDFRHEVPGSSVLW